MPRFRSCLAAAAGCCVAAAVVVMPSGAWAQQAAATAAAATPPAVLVADPALPGYSAAGVYHLKGALTKAGYAPRVVGAGLSGADLAPDRCRLLVLFDAAHLPTTTAAPVAAYLKRGGNIITLGARAWSEGPIRDRSGRWMRPADYQKRRDQTPVDRWIAGGGGDAPLDAALWSRSTDFRDTETRVAIIDAPDLPALGGGPTAAAKAADFHIGDMHGWDNFALPPFSASAPAFRPGDTLTVLYARGDENTHALNVEWDERDGSRWIATLPLKMAWQRYVLPPEAFSSWANPAARAAQGFHPLQAAKLIVGVDSSISHNARGPHHFAVAQIGTASDPRDLSQPTAAALPVLETMSPPYKLYPITDTGHLKMEAGQEPAPAELFSPYLRPSGAGIGKGRGWREVSAQRIFDALSSSAPFVPCGSLETVVIHEPGTGKDFAGGVWATFSTNDLGYLASVGVANEVESVARRMREPLFLIEGGSDFFTYQPGQPIHIGARVANLSRDQAADGKVRLTVYVLNSPQGPVGVQELPFHLAPGQVASPETVWTPPSPPPGRTDSARSYRVTVTLEGGDDEPHDSLRALNSAENEIHRWAAPAHPDYLVARPDGHFYLDGKRWRANGINYMPSSGIAVEDRDFYEYWMMPRAYDPEIVDRDLDHIADIGFNAVTISVWTQDLPDQDVLDVLRLARKHHLKVNLALRPGMPDQFDAAEIQKLITANHFADDDTIFAYDIAWEPEFRTQVERSRMDPEWRAWIAAHYPGGGGVAAAETAWGVPAPRTAAGQVTNPSGEQMGAPKGDPCAKLVADYRRFLDDWLAEHYGAAVRAIHAVDPHHYVSFRMSEAGDPSNDQRGRLPYSFQGVARAVDLLEPEGYGRRPSWEDMKPGVFELRYARSVAPTKPVLWAEAGISVWSRTRREDDPAAMGQQAEFVRNFYRMAREGDADGLFFWWYAGGLRYDENSDFGLVNPDGTDRPATKVIREEGRKFLSAPPLPALTVTLDYDRFAYPNDVFGIYEALKGPFWAAEDAGKTVGLRAVKP